MRGRLGRSTSHGLGQHLSQQLRLKGCIRGLLFAAYVATFFTLPPYLLWDVDGLTVGLLLTLFFLFSLAFRGSERIAKRLKVKPLSYAEANLPFVIAREYSRRLGIAPPRIGVIRSTSINAAVFGFSVNRAYIVLTQGALQTLQRDELAAVIARMMTQLHQGSVSCDSWLAQFLSVLDRFIQPGKVRPYHPGRRFYSFRSLLRQALIYPLSLIPTMILSLNNDGEEGDLKSARLSGKPGALSSSLRLMESMRDRTPLIVPFGTRHLFLLPPVSQDPLARVFFGHERLSTRIGAVDRLGTVVEMST